MGFFGPKGGQKSNRRASVAAGLPSPWRWPAAERVLGPPASDRAHARARAAQNFVPGSAKFCALCQAKIFGQKFGPNFGPGRPWAKIWGQIWVNFGPNWTNFGPKFGAWGARGPVLGQIWAPKLGQIWSKIGPILGTIWRPGTPGAQVWAPIWPNFGPNFGPKLGRLGEGLGQFWGQIWAKFGGAHLVWGQFGTILGLGPLSPAGWAQPAEGPGWPQGKPGRPAPSCVDSGKI